MLRVVFDGLSALLLFCTALIGCYCPRYLALRGGTHFGNGGNLAFHLGNMLSGGVMLSAGFCHLLADSLRAYTFETRFPVTTFLAALGYLVTLLADQVVQVLTESNFERDKFDDANGHANSEDEDEPGGHVLATRGDAHQQHPQQQQQQQQLSAREEHGSCETRPLMSDTTGRATTMLVVRHSTGHPMELSLPSPCHHDAPVKLFLSHKPLAFATAVLLAFALCIHSVLEGVALGSQITMRDTEDIMIAIAAHKGLAGYALGASIVESKASAKNFWTVVTIFSAATPAGIFVGYIFSELSSGRAAASMSALASGTFLYVAMMEVIPKELEDSRDRILKITMLLLGFSLMSLLAVWA